MQIAGKKILLTGATGGIGLEIARALLSEGADLLVTGRDAAKLAALQREMPAVDIQRADLNLAADRQQLVAVAAARGVNLLINAAGINQLALLEQTPDATLEQLLRTNLLTPMQLCRDLLPVLRQAPEAAIVNVGSVLGSIGYAGSSAYCASKFGLRGFTEALRRELADSPVQVVYFAPRATRTAMNGDRAVALNEALGVAMDSPQRVAAELLTLLRRTRPHSAWVGWPEKLFVRINSLLPQLVDSALRKQLPLIRRFCGH